jgi:hypothetical protein
MVQRRRQGRIHGPKPSRSTRPKSYKIACGECGKEVVDQVPPPGDEKLLCKDASKDRGRMPLSQQIPGG